MPQIEQYRKGAVLGLFPDIIAPPIGGAELSGVLAWEAIRHALGQQAAAHLFCYRPPYAAAHDRYTPDETLVHSKRKAVLTLLLQAYRPQQVIAWHVGMHKLLPCVRGRPHTTLFLHGIEAWKRHDPLTRLLRRRVDHFLRP